LVGGGGESITYLILLFLLLNLKPAILTVSMIEQWLKHKAKELSPHSWDYLYSLFS